MSGDLIDTTEMYLKTVFELHETGTAPMRARIADRLGHSGPTVSQTVARMERDGLLHLDEHRQIQLTEAGREMAMDVMRKHRLAERHLLDVIGLEYALVHEEACRWEHVMSLEVERRIAERLEPPYVDPYGNPIPGLAQLGIDETALTPEGQGISQRGQELGASVPEGSAQRLRLLRIGEVLQSDPQMLRDLADHGIVPGVVLEADRVGDSYLLRAEGREQIALPGDVAGQLHVTSATAE